MWSTHPDDMSSGAGGHMFEPGAYGLSRRLLNLAYKASNVTTLWIKQPVYSSDYNRFQM